MNKKAIIDAYVRIRTIDNTIPDDVLDFMKDASLAILDGVGSACSSIDKLLSRIVNTTHLIMKYTDQLNTMKANRSRWEEEKWTDAEVQECDRLIERTAAFIADLKSLADLKSSVNTPADTNPVLAEMLADLEEVKKLILKELGAEGANHDRNELMKNYGKEQVLAKYIAKLNKN